MCRLAVVVLGSLLWAPLRAQVTTLVAMSSAAVPSGGEPGVTGVTLIGPGLPSDSTSLHGSPVGGDNAPAAARLNALVYAVMANHGVWYSPRRSRGQEPRGVYFPFYGDLDLVAYLAALTGSGQSDRAILPVYSPEPIHFRRGQLVFVSTGFILQAHSYEELLQAIQSEIPCPGGDAAGFRSMQSKLALQVAEYVELTRPRLRRR